MQHFGYDGLIHEKKRKVEQISKEGWKLYTNPLNKRSWFNKRKRKVNPKKRINLNTHCC